MAEDPRVQCPKCGLRVRVPPERVPEGRSLTARCRRCGTPFDVRKLQGRVVVDVTPSASKAPKPESPKPEAAETKAPPPEKQRATPPPRTSIRPGEVVEGALPGGFQVGDRLGRYEIEGLAGRGGMGTVYRAFDPSANRHVALKVLRRDATDLDRVRFEREIGVQANIRHPHIMPIFDSGTAGTTRFYAMELLHEPVDLLHLAERVQFRRTDDESLRDVSTLPGVLEQVMLPVCQATHHANEEGVLHRDIKPINVMVDGRNLRPYLIDFGVSALLEPHNPRMEHIDRSFPMPLRGRGVHVTGTLMFMPPEQARGEANARGDVWALGALLHFLVTGSAPVEEAVRPLIPREERIQNIRLLIEEARNAGNNDEVHEYQEMLADVEGGNERTVEQLRRDVLRGRYLERPPGLDPRLDAIIAKAMHADPEQRYGDAGQLHGVLRSWLDHRSPAGTQAPGALEDAPRPLWRRPTTIAAAVVLVAGASAAAFWPRNTGPDPAVVAAGHLERGRQMLAVDNPRGARKAVRDAIAAQPSNDEAFELWNAIEARGAFAKELEDVQAAFKEAQADDVSPRERDRRLGAIAQRVKALQARAPGSNDAAMPVLEDLRRKAVLRRQLEFEPGVEGTVIDIAPWTNARGLGTFEPPPAEGVESGRYVIRFRRKGREVLLPFEVGSDLKARIPYPLDPARVPAGFVYVGGGAFTSLDGKTYTLPPLLWEKHEVTKARYAEFLEMLSPVQRRQRVPRHPGELGERGSPLWKTSGEGFTPPSGALRMPVESISQYDARTFAAFAKRRLPTAAEWTWAAAGPFAPATPLGDFSTIRGRAILGSGKALGAGETKGDRNVFGLFDMAGNLAEFTSTLIRDDEAGWVVKGGSYAAAPDGALVSSQRLVPGWLPQEGVGMRLVTDVSALAPPEEAPKKDSNGDPK